ncbi:MAG: reactive intermediate/imine deaminase [Vicinamibacteria bacterium]|nr:reactive intermediate/imine deaminase [Vicinamibacteria bacterium]
MTRKAVHPDRGPKPVGPYSPAIAFGELVFISGQGPMNPDTGQIERGDVVDEFKIAMSNVRLLLEAAGSAMDRVLKVTLYLADINDFARVNEAYKAYFSEPYPARSTIQAGRLPLEIKVEVDVIAAKS